MLEILSQKYLFQDLDKEELSEIAKFSKLVHYKPGETIIKKNEESYDCFILRKGRVDIFLSTANSIDDEQLGILSLYPYEIFGEMSCLIKKQRSATVISYNKSELLKINGEALIKYMDKNPVSGYHILKRIGTVLADKLKNTNMLWSQLNLVNQILKNTQKERADLYRVTAHELKSPISTVTSLLKSVNYIYKDKMDPKAYELTLKAEKRADTIISSIKDLLLLSEKTAGVKELNIESNRIKDILEAAIESEKENLQNAGIRISKNIEDNLPDINVDKNECVKIFTNLISNAVRYSPRNTAVKIIAGKEDNVIKVSVIDQGIGISKDDIPKIGQDFYRARNAKEKSAAGSGLGMAIVNSIIKQYGGSLKIESELNKGSEFIVRLPTE